MVSCLECGEEISVTEIPASGHSFGEWIRTKEPDCEEEGTNSRTCTVEGCNETETEPIEALGHSYATEFTIDVEATCHSYGSKSRHCTVSGCGGKTEVTRLEYVAHEYKEPYYWPEATCTESGIKFTECKNCVFALEETVAPLGHIESDDFIVIDAATCTEVGRKAIKCLRDGCGWTGAEEIIEATGHTEGADGRCTDCGMTLNP